MRAEGDDGRGHAAAAGGDERLVEVDPRRVERGLQIIAALPRAVGVEQFAEGQVLRTGDVTGGKTGARVAFLAGETPGVARVEYLLGAAVDIRQYLLLGAHRLRVAPHGEVAVAQRLLAHFERTPLGLPLGEPAVEQRDVVRAEQLQEPPGARRALQRAVVIDDDAAAVAEAQ